jgi:succinate dehydrogenase / fumarate reductase, membrane anchor subunit
MFDGPDSMRTEFRRVRYLGAAKSGTTGLWHMRLTSLALVPLTIAFVLLVLVLVGRPYDEVRTILGEPLPAILMLLFIGAGVYHMQLGLRTIIEDYVHHEMAKDWCLTANLFFAIAIGVTCIYAVCRLSFA